MVDVVSSPTIIVNNEVIAIVPNSFKYKSGKGNKNVRVGSSGGGATETIFSVDAETKKSMMSFSIYPSKANVDKVDEWQDNNSNNVVQAIDNDNNFDKTMSFAVITEDPEINLGADSVIELMFEGQAVV